ncbi:MULTISPECIES: ATP-dependent Clp protease proteolytic subunit [Enterobacter]|uniref:Protease n=2 Tax=Enterobacter cloacae complex TaxID=354276 RepID=A0A1S6XXS3_ENTCL|nr:MULTISPECIES: ATP-dependent Clp protease proteolytic subunit [Enterobacter]AQX35147.1 protease [Enterobacter cloacae]MDC7315498.1 ATP-dependent Clp protease proteolytic subunit [Enterobacter ludwigii]MDH1548049.1 ATP-dependent Clp protease proteolytic subunit [Enterobacter ludwigii]MDI0404983.1 ATP-dependent Clp protease proteolytic subunit [Enterobacter ludwigii]MDI0414221.1 ATP-dependent Clp protease proteolytic subunit [Enterobacter ludwigii]
MLKIYTSLILVYASLSISVVNAASIQKAYSANEIAKIYYSGDMNTSSISRLVSVFDEINKSSDIKIIYIYINSYGGDMDAGLMASAVIKSSRIPVTTVAMSTVGSSATIMLCAADDRRSLPDGYIYLHPSYINYNGDVRPNDIQEMSNEIRRFNNMFKKTYKTCTNLTDDMINNILYSESNRVTYTPEEAKKINLISVIDSNIVEAEKNYYVTNNGTDG